MEITKTTQKEIKEALETLKRAGVVCPYCDKDLTVMINHTLIKNIIVP